MESNRLNYLRILKINHLLVKCEGIDIEVVLESHIAKLEGAQTHIYIRKVGFKSPPSCLAWAWVQFALSLQNLTKVSSVFELLSGLYLMFIE
jgi:hypothetical protein